MPAGWPLRPGWRNQISSGTIDGSTVSLEQPLWEFAPDLERSGFHVRRETERSSFGGGQAIIVRDGTLFGGSDSRKDGCALGI